MNILQAIIAFVLILATNSSRAQNVPPSPQPQTKLDRLIEIDWSLGPDLPQGLQDSDGGFLGSQLITTCGYCSGGLEEDNRRKPGRYPRGFVTKTWAMDVDATGNSWKEFPAFPGAARQGVLSAVVGEALYIWGGFAYSAPFTYQDGYRLSHSKIGEWTWEKLPELPWKLTSAAMAVSGSKIYLCGGADYDGQTGFFTAHDRSKEIPRLGARLQVFDTLKPEAGWRPLPECPGTPRFVHAFQQVGGKLFLIGGAAGSVSKEGKNYGNCTAADNWSFDPVTVKWSRLRDLPVSSGNFPKSSGLVFRDRYIILPGGYQYSYVAGPDGSVRPAYGAPSRKRKESGLHNDIFVYDTRTDLFGTGTPMPIDNNLPMSVVRGDKLYLIGGETGGGEIEGRYFGHHPDLLLIGTMRLACEAPR